MRKINVNIQYFHGCPSCEQMFANVKSALIGLDDFVDFTEQLIETDEQAKETGFRGSPTVLIQGKDIEDMPSPSNPHLSCRYYPDGLPSAEAIRQKIIDNIGIAG